MSYTSEVLADSPNIFLKLDDASSPFIDSSGNAHTQTTTAPVSANQAGVSVEISASALFGGGRVDTDFGSVIAYSNITVEAWYKSTSGSGSIWTSRNTSGYGLTLFVGTTGAGFGATGRFSFGLDGGGGYQGVETNAAFHDGNWHHVVGTFSRTSGSIVPNDFKLYVDGALQSVTQRAVSGTTTAPITPTRNWTIGQHPAGWANGSLTSTNLASLALYSSVLSPARITTHYQIGIDDHLPPQISLAQYFGRNGKLDVSYKLSQGFYVSGSIAVSGTVNGTYSITSNQTGIVSISGLTEGQAYSLTLTPSNAYGAGTGYVISGTYRSSSYPGEILFDTPLAYWRLGDISGSSTMSDSSLNLRSGTYVNTPTLGSTGALAGDPNTSMTVASSPYGSSSSTWFGSRTSYSIEAWFKSTATGNQMIMGLDNLALGPGSAQRTFQLYLSGGSVIFLPLMSSGGYVVVTSPGASYNNGVWHHVVATWDGASAKLYIDGAQVASSAITGTTTNGGGLPILIGAGCQNAIGNVYLFSGSLDEVAVYPVALPASRVTAHYSAALDDGLAPAVSQVVPYSENGNLHLLFVLSQGYGSPVTLNVAGDLVQSFGPLANAARSHVSLSGTAIGTTYNLTVTATNSYGTSNGYALTYTHSTNTFVDAVMQDTPAVYHHSDETTGTRAYDRSLNDRDGTYSGTVALNDSTDPAVGASQITKHVRLDGTNGHIKLDSSSWLTPGSGFTFEAVVFIRSWPTYSRIFDFANALSVTDLLLTTTGSSNIRMYNGGNNAGSLSGMPLNTWSYLAVSVTSMGALTIYLNGSILATGNIGVLNNGSRQNKYIGKSGYSDPYLPASFAHFAVYNQALNVSRLDAHFSALGFPRSNVLMSRESAVVLANDTIVNRKMSRESVEVLVNDAVITRTISRVSLQVLIPTAARFRGWGLKR